jgi:LemA protein
MKNPTMIRLGIGSVLVLIAVIISVASVNGYKKLVVLQKNVDSHWSDLDQEYHRRALFMPDLIKMLSAEPSFDKAALAELAQACEKENALKLDPVHAPADASEFQQYVQAQQTLTKALSGVLIAISRNPSLMTNKSLRALEVGVIESGNRLAIKQNRFDQVVEGYNIAVTNFPTAIEATVLWFKPRFSF